MSKLRNPLVGRIPADTMNNCQQVLSVVQLATESQESGDDATMGYYLILRSVRQALVYEHDHHTERRESTEAIGKVSKIPGPD